MLNMPSLKYFTVYIAKPNCKNLKKHIFDMSNNLYLNKQNHSAMRKLLPVIASLAMASCSHVHKDDATTADIEPRTVQEVSKQPATEPISSQRSDLIQIIAHYNHVDQESINQILGELHDTTTLDAIVTDRSQTSSIDSKLTIEEKTTLPQNLQEINWYSTGTSKQSKDLTVKELQAYINLCNAKFSAIHDIQTRMDQNYIKTRFGMYGSLTITKIQTQKIVEQHNSSKQSINEVKKESKQRLETLYNTIQNALKDNDNIALVVHADYLSQISYRLQKDTKVSIILPSGQMSTQFQESRLRIESQGLRDNYQKFNQYLDTVIKQNKKLNDAYNKFLKTQELPRDKTQI